MPFAPSKLPDRAVISVHGPDAASFLHGLVTADVERLAPGAAAYGALLSPQGKILSDFFILHTGDRYLIDCAAAQGPDLIRRLGFYKLRAKVDVRAQADAHVAALPPRDDGQRSDLAFMDPRLQELGRRRIAPDPMPAEPAPYHAHRIGLGVADSSADIGSGEMFPHEANLDQLNGVSFTKGCYVGQEVVSRMEHRGTARSRILPVTTVGGAPAKGTAVMAADKPVGTMLSSAGPKALALIRLDRLADAIAAGVALSADGNEIQVGMPPWARFDAPRPKRA